MMIMIIIIVNYKVINLEGKSIHLLHQQLLYYNITLATYRNVIQDVCYIIPSKEIKNLITGAR